MKLSIVTCTYNSEKYLQECIDSVIAQNLDKDDYEHIFVDAYSTDKTKEIIREYMKKYSNVKLIERKPKWVYNAMNEWIKEARWDYILCLNSDDHLEKGLLKWYLKFIKDTNFADVYCAKMYILNKDWLRRIVPNKFIMLRKLLFKLWFNVYIYHPTVLMKRSEFVNMWCFDETKKVSSDFWMRLKCQKEWKKILFYSKVVTNFVEHWDNASWNLKLSIKETNDFRVKYLWSTWKVVNKISNIFIKCNKTV